MDSPDTPIMDNDSEIKTHLAEAQAALEILRVLQTDHRELNSQPPAGTNQEKTVLDQTQQALERVSLALDQELARRAQAERAQNEWEQRFRAITDAYPVAVGVSAMDGTLLYLNKVYTQLYGYSLDELIEKKAADLYWDPQDRNKWLDILKEKGLVRDIEVQLRRKDGTPFWARLTAARTNFAGAPAVIGTIIDITEYKRLQAIHQESEEMYTAIFDRSPFALSLTRIPEGILVAVNDAFLTLFGFSHEELIGKTSLELGIADADSSAQVATELKQNGFVRNFAVLRRTKSGEGRTLSLNLDWVSLGGEKFVLTTIRDITERKHAEQRLAYLASFPEVNPRPITEVDRHGSIHYANPTAMRLFPDLMEKGLSHPWLVDWDSVIHPIQDGQLEVTLRDVAVGERYYQQSLNHIAPQGLVRIYGVDITERKLAEQALRQAHDELEQKVLERTQELNIANEQLRGKIIEHQNMQNELESSLQELQVIEEELRNNNKLLVDAQKVLDTERQRYQDLFDFAPDGYLVTDGNGLILEANHYATQLLGIPYHSLVGKPLLVFISPVDHPGFHHLLSNLKLQSGIQSQELKLLPRTGTEVSVAVTIASAKDPTEKDTLRWTLRDITERKHAEEIIRQNSRRNAVMSEVSQTLAGASLDEHAILDIVAKTATRSIGDGCVINLTAEDGQGLNTVAWHHNQPETLALMDSLLNSSQFQTADGLAERVYETSQPVLIQNLDTVVLDLIREKFRSYITQTDITSMLIVPLQISNKTVGTISLVRSRGSQSFTDDEQALLECLANRTAQTIHNARLYQELQNALQNELETHDQLVQAEKFAAVGRLLASITHEINNPLQTIKNCLYLSQMDTAPGTPAYEALVMATTETNRLSNLVAQLREIYRPPTHGQSRPVQIPALLGEVETLLAGYLQEKHINWELAAPAAGVFEGVVVEAVPDQLKQVFLNICLNATDAMEPDGGKINISFSRPAEQDRLGICIRDTGPGLSQEVKEKLFEPFTTTKENGLGLGLAICYDIIQKHNGSIEVESAPGGGAAFTVWLPVRSQPRAPGSSFDDGGRTG